MASFGFMVIRGAFAVAEHLAPRLTGRAAFALFSRTPRARRISQRERAVLESARETMDSARRHRLQTPQGCIAAYDFAPVGAGRLHAPCVLVLHGWGSRAAHMASLIAGLAESGFRVIALDLPGHGESAGRRLNMASAVRAVHEADQWFGPFAAVIGHSFGGAVAANAVVGSIAGVPKLRAGRLVMISAPNSMPAIFSDFSRFLNLGTRTQTALAEGVQAIAGRPLEDFVVARQLAADPLPALVVHAPDDKEVPAREAEALAAAGAHVRLVWAPGLGHRRIVSDRGVARQVADFIADPEIARPAC